MSSYAKHFLTNVILRIDFVSGESQLKTEINTAVKEICIKHFPIAEEKKVEIQEFHISNNPELKSTMVNQQSAYEWHFFGKNREKELCITDSNIFVDFKVYSNFEDFKNQFWEVLTQLLTAYPEIKINRIGLRYIDQISLVGDKTQRKNWKTYWTKYISAQLIEGLAFADADASLARHMNSIEMNYGDHMLRFQYGIHNEDYPAPNKKQVFILDTDIYSIGLFSLDEIDAYLGVFHDKAKAWFERAIKDALRKKMGVKE